MRVSAGGSKLLNTEILRFMTDLTQVQALWVLGEMKSDSIPQIAADLLEDGYDSLRLRRLAALVRPDWFDVHDDFEAVLRELGVPAITKEQAWLRIVRRVAEQIVACEVSPAEGAGCLAHLGLDQPYQSYAEPYEEDLLAFELLTVDRNEIDEPTVIRIRSLASSFLSRTQSVSR